MSAGEKDTNVEFNSENIFEELTGWVDIQKEVQKEELKKEKWGYYYLNIFINFLIYINVSSVVWLILFSAYGYIQSSEKGTEYDFLSPICSVFLWESSWKFTSCYGVSYKLNELNTSVENLKSSQTSMLIPVVWDIYSLENFNLSRKVSFLLDKSQNRLRPAEILKDFDEVKSQYSSVDKSEIQCNDITISGEWLLDISCDVYSSDWDTKIVTLDDGVKSYKKWWGTSITRAISFLDYIEKSVWSPFSIIQKPKTLWYTKIQSWPYTQKTEISFTLKHNDIILD